MALSSTRIRDAIILGIESAYGFTFTPAQKAEAEKVWGVVATAIINEFDVNADIVLGAGNITVPATGLTAPVGGGAVTGTASIAAVTLTGKIA